MRLLLTYENDRFAAQIEYALRRLVFRIEAEFVVVPYEALSSPHQIDAVISYGRNRPNTEIRPGIHIYESDFFGDNFLTEHAALTGPLASLDDLPVVFSGPTDTGEMVERSPRLLATSADLVASTFFLLSRYEEVVSEHRDEYGRFPASASLAYKEGFLWRPLADEYSILLETWLSELGVAIHRKKFWRDKDFAVCLTHDIDEVSGGWLQVSYRTLGRIRSARDVPRALGSVIRTVTNRLKGQDPYWNFSQIQQIENRFGLNSTFFFLAGGNHRHDGNYDVTNPRFQSLFQDLEGEGGEIGLHGSYDSLVDDERLGDEKRRLEMATGHNIGGVRQHFLRFDVRDRWRQQQKTGFAYDSSLAFADHTGYRASTSYPFRPYDLTNNRPYDIIEIPIILMDTTLCKYEKTPATDLQSHVEGLLATTKKIGGCLTVVWHNIYFVEGKHPGYRKLYEHILEWTQGHSGLAARADEVCEMWLRANGHPAG